MIAIVGILNCTPDSFSDGGAFGSSQVAIDRALQMIDEGADSIEVGGDSTRPGSICVGIEEEWRRTAPIFKALGKRVPLAVDTHHPEVAIRAFESGVGAVNDVTGVASTEMLRHVKAFNARYVGMCNPNRMAHNFERQFSCVDVLESIHEWSKQTQARCRSAGLEAAQVVLDTGMGGFLGRDADVSWKVIRAYREFTARGCALMFGSSRKGFLKKPNEAQVDERDHLSSLCGAIVARSVAGLVPVYLRVHNVALQKSMLQNLAHAQVSAPARGHNVRSGAL